MGEVWHLPEGTPEPAKPLNALNAAEGANLVCVPRRRNWAVGVISGVFCLTHLCLATATPYLGGSDPLTPAFLRVFASREGDPAIRKNLVPWKSLAVRNTSQ